MTELQIVITSCANRDEAERIARRLVEARCAACVNIVPGVHSVYRWRGQVESADEVLLLIKTSAALVPEVERAIAKLHSYELPECVALAVEGGSDAYLQWWREGLK